MTDTVKTRRDLIDKALEKLGVLQSGQSPSDEDVDRMDDFVDPVIATLAANGVAYVATSEEIPVEFYLPIASVLANAAKASFGLAGDPKLKMEADDAEDLLREINRPQGSRPTLKVDNALRYHHRGQSYSDWSRG